MTNNPPLLGGGGRGTCNSVIKALLVQVRLWYERSAARAVPRSVRVTHAMIALPLGIMGGTLNPPCPNTAKRSLIGVADASIKRHHHFCSSFLQHFRHFFFLPPSLKSPRGGKR